MAQFVKLLTVSKLLLPFTAIGVLGVGSCYVTYNVSRWTTASLLRVDPNNTSTTCEVLSSGVGGVSLLTYLYLRHNNYSPPTLTRLLQMAVEAAAPAPPTTAAGLPLTGPLQASALPANTIVSSSHAASSLPSSSTSRLRQVLSVIRVPARFYAMNVLVGAAVLGAGTSAGQRLLCGRMQQKADKHASMR